MPYPPGARPTNLTDSTPSGGGFHSNDLHNLDGHAINDIVGELGPQPRGGDANLTARLAGIVRRSSGVRNYGAGLWVTPGIVPAAVAFAIDRLYVIPLVVVEEIRYDALSVNVTTAGAAGSVFRSCIYADDGSWYPGPLHIDFGSHDTTVVGARSLISSMVRTLTPGVWWLGGRFITAAASLTAAHGNTHDMPTRAVPTTTYATGAVTVASTTTPATFPAGATDLSGAPRVALRLAA